MSSRGQKSLSLLQDQDSMTMFDFILNKVNKEYCRKEKGNLRVDARSSRLLEIEMGLALARSRAALTGPSSSLSPITAHFNKQSANHTKAEYG